MAKKKPNDDRKKYKKMQIEDRIRLLEDLYIHFPRNAAALKAIEECHNHVKTANEAEGVLIQGETGAGKTTITGCMPEIISEDLPKMVQSCPCYARVFQCQRLARVLQMPF